jgi:hypothetical protein
MGACPATVSPLAVLLMQVSLYVSAELKSPEYPGGPATASDSKSAAAHLRQTLGLHFRFSPLQEDSDERRRFAKSESGLAGSRILRSGLKSRLDRPFSV